MSKNTFIAIIVAVIIGAGTAVIVAQRGGEDNAPPEEATVTQNQDDTPEPEDGEDEELIADHAVTYTDDGFIPNDVTIQAGEVVAFENDSSSNMWVASDPHPTHTDLPAFDSQRGIEPGEAYSFTFEDPGQWGYHDHLQSFREGIIRVQ